MLKPLLILLMLAPGISFAANPLCEKLLSENRISRALFTALTETETSSEIDLVVVLRTGLNDSAKLSAQIIVEDMKKASIEVQSSVSRQDPETGLEFFEVKVRLTDLRQTRALLDTLEGHAAFADLAAQSSPIPEKTRLSLKRRFAILGYQIVDLSLVGDTFFVSVVGKGPGRKPVHALPKTMLFYGKPFKLEIQEIGAQG